MSAGNSGGPEWPSNRENDAAGEESAVHSTSGGDFDGLLGFGTVGSAEKEARVSLADADNSVETRVSENMNESRVLKVENEESRLVDESGEAPENQPSSSVSRGHGNGKKDTDLRNGMSERKKEVDDYDSMLSEFDQFAAKGAGEAVGYGYEIGDMVWGKVKSHPWWPGHIYNEAFASPSVQRSKREGHVLVAFLVTVATGVEEAVDELSRRRVSGLVCCCRNEFNFSPSTVEGYFVVDVGDYEPGVYSLRQINKARESFRPREMLSFVQQLALTPKTDQHWSIEFIKNKAAVLACRKALFEEFDETYAQAFGTVPVRPPRPTAPLAVDPSKGIRRKLCGFDIVAFDLVLWLASINVARQQMFVGISSPLSGRLVIAEALGKGKLSVKATKSKDQVEKDKYLFKRRDAPTLTKTNKKSSVQVGPSVHPVLIDGSGLSGINDGQHQPSNDEASVVSSIKPSKGGAKNAKVRKRHAGESSAENATSDTKKNKKRKKEINTERLSGESSAENVNPVQKKQKKKEIRSEPSADIGAAVEKVSGMLLDVPLGAANNNQLENRKKDDASSSSSPVETQQADDHGKVELQVLVRDLRALALDPFHGVERRCPGSTQLVFLKYRSLVYQKSLVLSPPTENETTEARSSTLPASTFHTEKTNDKSTTKLMKPSARPIDDPTIGGKKRGPSNRPETIKKKGDTEGINKRRKLVGSEDIKKKKKIIDDSKLIAVEKKMIPQRSTESQRADAREIAVKNVPPTPLKAVKPESRVRSPTMLVMKFPSGAALPSGAQLRAKFARFGQLDLAATRVFWKTYTCRLVFRQKADAEEALKFALGNSNLFGNTNVRCYTREVEVEAAESEPVRVQKEDVSAGPPQSAFENRTAAKTAAQQSAQLKSCLKRPSNEEGGNGNGRGTRVKFILGGDVNSSSIGSTKTEQVSMDVSNKNLPKFIPQSSSGFTTTPSPTHQFQKFPNNMPSAEILLPRSFNVPQPTQQPTKDISKQLLNLLTRCSDVVNNVTGVLGYTPYHSL
ncbi:hypothetical protein DH2020_024272 [Rehmannia glutinosa]|uniref:PWWP domain-containing protein n=1 Tax=Rehmannia glutinosa TaxID=99300 RepID=A0ABR0WC75_REHGL